VVGGGDIELLEVALAAQEELRGRVPDAVVDATVAALRRELDEARRRVQPKRRRLATVLFADVSGSTEIGGSIDAEELSDRFDELWETLDRIIRSHGGVVDKHIGDAVMALWGVHESSENDPERAIRAALAMLGTLDGLRERDVLPGAAMRIGINTGPVVFGPIAGTAESTAMGDTVNVAARLEAAAPLDSILIGHDTYQHVRGIFTVGRRDALTVKGKLDPLRTYLVEGVRPRAFRLLARPIDGVETPMVARDGELRQLQAALERTVRTGRPEIAVVTGAAGMGKSRLLFEFEDWLRTRDDEVRRFSGRGDPEQQGTAYGVLRDVVFDRFEITEDEADPIARARLAVGIRDLTGADLDHEIDVVSHLIELDDDRRAGASGYDVGDGATALAAILTAVSRRTPVVLLLEDMQWSDPASATLFAALSDRLHDERTGARILVVAVQRTAESTTATIPTGALELALGPLADAEIEGLLTLLLARAETVPTAVIDRVTAAAGGNPFYVEELVRMFLDEGVVTVTEDGWRLDVARLDRVGVPPTLQGVLQARLDRLPRDEFVLLQRAAIVGPRFWSSSLPSLDASGAPPDRTGTAIPELIRKGLLEPVPSSDFAGDEEFRFAHTLLHEAVYESILLSDRSHMHAQVAEWMANRAEGAAATVAGHYRSAGRLADAARWSATAARRARRRNAAEEGIAAALAALADGQLDDRARADCIEDLIECLTIAARYDEALEHVDEMESIGERLSDPALRALARSVRSHLLTRLGRSRDALTEAESALAVVGELPTDSAAAVDALTELGWVLVRLGRTEEALVHADDALRRLAPSHGVALRHRATSLAGVAAMTVGRFADAERHLSAGLDLVRLHGDRRHEAGYLINLSEISRLRGDLDRAARLADDALQLVQSIRDLDQEALVLSNLGGIRVEQGEVDDALPLLTSALDAFERTGASEHTSETHRFLAEAHLGLGDLAAARAEVARALDLANADASPDHLGHAWLVTARLCAATGEAWHDGADELDASACLRRACALFETSGLHRERAVALVHLSELTSGPERAALLDEAHGILSRLDLPLLAERVRRTTV
jgi:class 3 adenylate cyclase/tetratricopeptide (TPR) repeat protein